MVKVVVLGFPTKLQSKLNPDQIREALQPTPAQSKSGAGLAAPT